ncbi:cytochrome P450 [Streptomyces sp. CB03238]|uniref:cytochrome P450 n=1 Tax=Streptomyces sp. CB03238 TaxID=1907777 RepID=UPI000A1020E6|nr:cytochrome P450 [Streptomyces sp. CB03238]ORT56541.1 cytochrome [Streptomyces sp. CB03238]
MTTEAVTSGPEAGTPVFPYKRKCPFSQPEEYGPMMEKAAISKVKLITGIEVWAVTGYENIRQLLMDPRISSSRKHENFPFYFQAPPEFRTETSFIGYDAPEHTTTRRKAAVTFTNRRVQRLRENIAKNVDERLDALIAAGSPADLHAIVSLPVPMTLICELLGVPYEDHAFFAEHGTNLLGGHSSAEQRQAAMVEVGAYLEKLVDLKEREPADDLISRAIVAYKESGEEYTRRDLVNLCRLLMNGGHETTANMISLCTMALLRNPEQLEQLKADPELIGPAIEELVRYITIGDLAIPRVALEDIEIDGVTIKKGDGILCLSLTANRDPKVFDRPDELILSRGTRRHLGFGHGAHYCIGADLARVELEIAISKIFERLPNLQLAVPFEDIRTKEGSVVYGVWALPVKW